MPMLMTFRMRLPVWPFHSPLRTRSEKCRHLVQHGVDFRHDIFAVHQDGGILGRAQGDVQHGAVFRDVDFLAAEHRVDLRAQTGFLGQLQQQLERLVRDAVFGIIQKKSGGLGGQSFAAFGVVGEQFSQMQFLDLFAVRGEGLPGRALVTGLMIVFMLVTCSFVLGFDSPSCGFCYDWAWWHLPLGSPQAKSAEKSVGVVARAAAGWQLLQFVDVAAAQDHSSGSMAATRRFTTSATCRRHFFLPCFSSPRIPT